MNPTVNGLLQGEKDRNAQPALGRLRWAEVDNGSFNPPGGPNLFGCDSKMGAGAPIWMKALVRYINQY